MADLIILSLGPQEVSAFEHEMGVNGLLGHFFSVSSGLFGEVPQAADLNSCNQKSNRILHYTH